MKSIKYFAALAFPAMLAACANEEIQIETPQTMQKVVGAEFIGTDISMVASKGSPDSRFAGGESGFGKSDKLGLGWVTITGPSTPQVENGELDTQSRLYANHLFEYVEGATNTFTTKSNIYKGYHFAYYPYAYMEEVGPKTIEISPKQEVGYVDGEAATAYNLRLAQQFQMSAFQFLDKNSLTEDYQLKREFQMKTPLSQLIVKTTAEGSFATNTNLKGYQIKSVTFNLGKEVFAHSAKLDLTKLFKLGTNPRPDMTFPQANEQGLLNSFAEVLCPIYPTTTTTNGQTTVEWNNGRSISAKTEVAVESYIVSAKNPRLMTFVLPMNAATSFTDEEKEAVSIEIEAGGGKFVVDYTPGAEEGTAAYKNNQTLAQLVAAYETNGAFVGKYNQQETLNIILTEADFVADFTGVTNENWAEKVQLANDLNRGVEEFVLAEGANVIFDGKNLDADGKPLAPTAGVIVKTVGWDYTKGTLTIGALNTVTEWNEKINVNADRVTLTVAENAALKVNTALTPSRMYNYGTIYAGPMAEVGKLSNGRGFLMNYNRVEVEYGAYVNVDSQNKGTIAYTLTSADVENPSQIKEMIATSGNAHGHANVNTIVVGNTIDIDLYKNVNGSTGSTEEGRYNDDVTPGTSATGAAWIADLSKVNFEINGGKVKASYAPVNVANVSMDGGILTNVNIKGELTATGDVQVTAPSIEGNVTVTGTTEASVTASTITGVVVADNTEMTVETINGNVTLKGESAINNAEINGNITVENGTATLTNVAINGTLTIKKGAKVVANSENIMSITAIVNIGGELESDNDIKVTDITLQNMSVTTLGADWGKTIWYTGNYVHNNSSVNGWVKKCPTTAAELEAALEGAVEGSTIYLNDNVADYGTITVGELKDVIIEGNENSVMIFKTDANTKIENVTLKGVNFQYTGTAVDCGIVINVDAQIDNLVLENCTFVGNGAKAGRGLSGYNNNASIVIKNCTFENMGYPIYAWGGYESLTIEGCTFENIKSWAIMPQSGFDGDLIVTGCNFINCLGGGLIKAGTLTAGHTFTFTNNTITDCTVAGDHNWFSFNVSAGKTVISGNTKDGSAWTPTAAEGLNK